MKQQDKANRAFIDAALEYSGASVFVDASTDPYRMRHLQRIKYINLRVLYLIRDPRGVSRSTMKTRKWSALRAINWWLRDQLKILRISSEFTAVLPIYYENLCDSVDDALANIHQFVDLESQVFSGDFTSSEHHILGNSMRLTGESRIRNNEQWREDLSKADFTTITDTLTGFVDKHPQHALSTIINHYLG